MFKPIQALHETTPKIHTAFIKRINGDEYFDFDENNIQMAIALKINEKDFEHLCVQYPDLQLELNNGVVFSKEYL